MQYQTTLSSLQQILEKLPQRKIAQGITILLICYLAYLCAQLTWLMIDDTRTLKPTSSHGNATIQSIKQIIDTNKIQQLNLFGQYNEQVQEVTVQVKDAPQTKLRLTLTGTVASDDITVAAAIIENNGKQETYGIGDKITGTRAVLDTVSFDRVLIKQSGKLETLMLDGFKYNKQSNITPVSRQVVKQTRPATVNKSIVDQRQNIALSEQARQLKQDINQDPGKITDYLRIIPKRRAGKVIGYQLMPGKNKEFFKSSGLKSGDIAIQMNGLDLTIPSEAAQGLQALKQEQELSLLVNRNDEIIEILFSIQ